MIGRCKKMKSIYQRNLINSIKAFGEWISENAEKIGNEIEGRTSLDITASWESWEELQPDISINHKYISKKATEAMFKKEESDENI